MVHRRKGTANRTWYSTSEILGSARIQEAAGIENTAVKRILWTSLHGGTIIAEEELKDLPEAGEEELSMMTKIVDKMTKDRDLRMYHDGYKERIEALITSKMKGEVGQVKEEKPKKPTAKSMMEMLRETAGSLK
ncbi:MAG: hypothetical protein ABR985_09445 [Methanotrichaceae archaeon]